MALTDREQQTLADIARRVRAEDPAFVQRLRGFGGSGPVLRRRLLSRRRLLPIAFVLVIVVLGVLLLPQGTAHGWAIPHGSGGFPLP